MKLAGALVLALFLVGGTTNQRSGNSQTSRTEVCKPTTDQEIAALFVRWNNSLQTGNPQAVVANYAVNSILLPTQSNEPRLTPAAKVAYFSVFLQKKPKGEIKSPRFIERGCNFAVDAGLYDFTFGATTAPTPTVVVHARYSFTYRWDRDRAKWLITSHHSSVMPE